MSRVLLREELLAQLGSRRALDAAVRAGAWRRVLHGAYVPAAEADRLEVRAQAARRVLPDRCWVADRSLLWLLGVDVLPAAHRELEVVVERGAVVPRREGVRAREALVPRSDQHVLQPWGVRSLRPVRAAADLLRLLPPTEAVVVADAVQHPGLATREQLAAELAAHRGLRGVRLAHEALRRSDGLAESPQETRLRLLLVDAGLQPVTQLVVDLGGGVVARLDLALPEARLALEYDGRAVHGRDEAFLADRRRQNALVAAGWTVLRVTAEDLRRPQALLAQVRAVLARAA